MKAKRIVVIVIVTIMIVLGSTLGAAAKKPGGEPFVTVLASGLQGALGSTVGPDHALYVTEGALGRVTRVDPKTGAKSTFAEGLPTWVIPLGGAVDVAFLDGTAYVLVTMTNDPLLGMVAPAGIYRIDGPNSSTLIADIGAYADAHPPVPDFFLVTGVQYALETFRGGFLVTDGHHNRVYYVTLDGTIAELITFDDIVPTGLETQGNTIFMAEAGPAPHEPQNGKIVSFAPDGSALTEVASGARLLVDVERGRGQTLYGLSQGVFPDGGQDGDPAKPNTGSLVQVNGDGGFNTIVENLNQPTSLEFIGNNAYVVTLPGDIYKIVGVSGPPFGRP